MANSLDISLFVVTFSLPASVMWIVVTRLRASDDGRTNTRLRQKQIRKYYVTKGWFLFLF